LLILREEQRLWLFENRVLKRIFGPKRDEVTGERRKLHNEEFHENEMGRACSTYGERRGVYRILMRKHEEKRQLGRPRRRWEDNIKMGLQEVGCRGMNWINLA
jgi:hypothetical protein